MSGHGLTPVDPAGGYCYQVPTKPYSPSGPLNTFAPALHPLTEDATPSGQCLQLGLPGYLIRFAPLAFVPHRRIRSS